MRARTRRPRQTRLGDVARLAGVSTVTVSRVLNGSGTVSEAHRHKILRLGPAQEGLAAAPASLGTSWGRRAAEALLLSLQARSDRPVEVRAPTHFVPRGTTGPALDAGVQSAARTAV